MNEERRRRALSALTSRLIAQAYRAARARRRRITAEVLAQIGGAP